MSENTQKVAEKAQNSEQTAAKSDEKARIMPFDEFVAEDSRIVDRVLAVIHIIAQDLYLFLNRLAIPDGPEREKMAKRVAEVVAEAGGDVTTIDEGFVNRQKDKAIREMFIYEELRQYTIALKEVQGDKK